MKQRLVSHLVLGFSLVALPFLGGCTRQNAGGSNPFVSSANAEPASGENELAAVTETATNAPAATVEAIGALADTNATIALQTNAATQAGATTETAPPSEQKPPPNVRLSPVLSEAVKLVQSGVDQSVLFTYITNTTGYFMLGAEEIVYLNDLGVSGNVITTMMEHDKGLRELRMNAWQAAQAALSNQVPPQIAQPEPETASAPSYVEPPAMEAEPVYVSDNYFYDTLSPYGSWIYVNGYGRCWRPTVAACNPGWRPYCDRGRWVYSDCGWYWLSDYSWGSTAFHYGRWFNAGSWGWCWYPDTVWSPSWVSWRYTSDYCGWAPLPPNCYYQSGFGLTYNNGSVGVSFGFGLGPSCYAFVPWGNFCSPRPYQYCVPASRAYQVYNTSTPVNHWEGGSGGRAYNRGIAPERVRQYSRTEVRTVSVKDQAGNSARAERIDRDGHTLTVRRPQFTAAPTGVANMSDTSGRNTGQVNSRTREPVISTPQPQPTSPAPSTAGRVEVKSQPEQSIANRTVGRPISPIEAKPLVATSTRVENRNDGEETVNRARATSPVVVRPTQQQPVTLTVPATTTVKTPQPRVIQATPQTTARPTPPAQRSSIIVIGGGNNTRSGGRDYSVWNTPSPSSTPSSPPNNVSPRTVPSTTVNTPEIVENSSSPVTRGQVDRGWQNRGNNNNNRPDNRGAYSTYSTPQAGQVITPNAPSPGYYNNTRPVQSAPAPSYVPRSQSQSSPSPSAAQVESRPAPAPAQPQATTRTTVPATSQSSQAQGRPSR